ncbi:hypothetical protein AVEN_67797-1 [Araneus ventricosus]|uniref:Uncharacterized protein n=1 Tax=Araneus ventricosus TaxID=182803 RepID=A0A4Y2J4T0_ARAVE|nr:hypothetical protein AVEN_67797-1 [Araneus ventricosus]
MQFKQTLHSDCEVVAESFRPFASRSAVYKAGDFESGFSLASEVTFNRRIAGNRPFPPPHLEMRINFALDGTGLNSYDTDFCKEGDK